ncbi:MAG: hypothetical protein O2910_05850 [Proteobacteria bacterium]|nr:hypothetical protein [Pseudomonadota bacterium]
MKKLFFAAIFLIVAPALAGVGPASAFQVITPEQMQDGGMGLAEGRYFSTEQAEQQGGFRFEVNGNRSAFSSRHGYNDRSSSENNYYGNVDGGGRYFGDSTTSNSQGCNYAESNAGQLDAMSGRGYAYPCQRFR